MSVFNAERLEAPNGKPNNISGYAYQGDPSEPGRLTLRLQGVPTSSPCKLNCIAKTDNFSYYSIAVYLILHY